MKVSKGKKVKFQAVNSTSKEARKFDKERHRIFKLRSRFKARKAFKIVTPRADNAYDNAMLAYNEQLRIDAARYIVAGCKHEFKPRNRFEYTAVRGSAFDADTAHEFKAA